MLTSQLSNSRCPVRCHPFRSPFIPRLDFFRGWIPPTLRYLFSPRISHRDISRTFKRGFLLQLELNVQSNLCIFLVGWICQDMEPRATTESVDITHPLMYIFGTMESSYRRHVERSLLRQPPSSLGSENPGQRQQPSYPSNSYSFAPNLSRSREASTHLSTGRSTLSRLEQISRHSGGHGRS